MRNTRRSGGYIVHMGMVFVFIGLSGAAFNRDLQKDMQVANKAKVEPKTVQETLQHAKIQTTLDLYTQEDSIETRAAQGEFLTAVAMSTTLN